MSVDKFGRHSSGQIYSEPGVSLRFVNNNFLRKGEIDANNNKIINVADPSNDGDATSKRYVDGRKPLITIWASHEGPLHSNAYEWSFGDGFAPSNYGYPVPTSGRILRIVVSSKRPTSSQRSVRVSIVINGNVVDPRQGGMVSLHPGTSVISIRRNPPIELAMEDHINIQTSSCNGNEEYSAVSLLIELDA